MLKMKKKSELLNQAIIHLILIALIFVLFFGSATMNVNSRTVKQQVLEKQLALMIDSAHSGTVIAVNKMNLNGFVDSLEIKGQRIFAGINGLSEGEGYPFFSSRAVKMDEDENKFYIYIG